MMDGLDYEVPLPALEKKIRLNFPFYVRGNILFLLFFFCIQRADKCGYISMVGASGLLQLIVIQKMVNFLQVEGYSESCH